MYQKIFAQLYDPFMHNFENKFLAEKRKLLLKNLKSPVLEIGFGTGANFDFYPEFIELFVIEKSPFMLKKFKEKNKNQKNLKLYIQEGRIDKDISSFNFPKFFSVVSTLTLCSVENLEKALKNIYYLLNEDGIFYIIEHIASKKRLYRNIQNIISPMWKIIGDGCHINRNTDEILKQYFEPIYEEYFFYGVDFYFAKLKKRNF